MPAHLAVSHHPLQTRRAICMVPARNQGHSQSPSQMAPEVHTVMQYLCMHPCMQCNIPANNMEGTNLHCTCL